MAKKIIRKTFRRAAALTIATSMSASAVIMASIGTPNNISLNHEGTVLNYNYSTLAATHETLWKMFQHHMGSALLNDGNIDGSNDGILVGVNDSSVEVGVLDCQHLFVQKLFAHSNPKVYRSHII